MSDDEQHLRLLSVFYYVLAGIAGLLACFPVFHVLMGVGIVTGAFPQPQGQQPLPPAFMGWMFIAMGGAIMLFGWAFAVGMLVTGRMLAARRRHLFCLVMAGVACLFQPAGTVLGVFTFIVLLRPSVKQLFGAADPPAPAEAGT